MVVVVVYTKQNIKSARNKIIYWLMIYISITKTKKSTAQITEDNPSVAIINIARHYYRLLELLNC